MAIFPNLILEDKIQLNDKTRLDGSKSFVSKTEATITLVRIKPEASGSFVTVSGTGLTAKDWYLDWQYTTAGTKTATCEVTTNGAAVTADFTIEAITEATDNLFSDDSDLTGLEYDVLKWIPVGRNTYKNVHRKSQNLILAWLDENGYTDSNGARLTAAALVNLEEVKYWSTALTLQLIFSSISNDPNDVFSVKAKQYESMALSHRNRSVLRIDVDGDGTIDTGEGINIKSVDLIRR